MERAISELPQTYHVRIVYSVDRFRASEMVQKGSESEVVKEGQDGA
jgi:hypothetical protein